MQMMSICYIFIYIYLYYIILRKVLFPCKNVGCLWMYNTVKLDSSSKTK